MKKINKLLLLKNKVALITGGGGHLGSEIAKTFASLGVNLILVDLPGSKIKSISSTLKRKYNIKVSYFYCDFESGSDRAKLISNLVSLKKLDILINNAAFTGNSEIDGWNNKFENQSIEKWRKCLEINLVSIFEISRALNPLLKKSKNGTIINISSIYSEIAPDWSLYKDTEIFNPAAYGASKAGLNNLTKWLANTLAPNVRVNSVLPGGIKRNQSKKFIAKYNAKTPLRRMANESDIVGTVIFLSSSMSNYITGQNIRVDGGFGN